MLRRLDHFAEVFYGKSPAGVVDEDGLIPVFGTSGVYGRARKSLFPGPAVVAPRKGSLERPHFSPGPFWPSDTTFAVLPRRGVDPLWLYHQLSLFELEKLNEATGVPSIGREWLSKIEIEDQSESTQSRIVSIIRAIDAQIERTEALIAKLKRVRTGLTQDLLTRGIDQSGHLRPTREEASHLYYETEVGWLAKGWELKTVQYCAQSLIDGPFGSNLKTEHYVPEPGVKVVRLQNIQAGFYNDGDRMYVSDEHARRLSAFSVADGDVLIASLGDEKHEVGRACVYPAGFAAAINKADCFRLRPNAAVASAMFVTLCLNADILSRQKARVSQGVTRDRMNLGNCRRLMLPIAPIPEQQRIGAAIQASEACLEDNRTALSKLQHLKNGLMRDLLSGVVGLDHRSDHPEA